MTNIKSNHTSPLALPNGQVINPNSVISVDNWSIIADHHVVKAWLTAKVIEVEVNVKVEVNAPTGAVIEAPKPEDGKKGK